MGKLIEETRMERLVEKAKAVFADKKSIYTNEGLSRMELRKLKSKKYVENMQTSGMPIRLIWQAKEELWKSE